MGDGIWGLICPLSKLTYVGIDARNEGQCRGRGPRARETSAKGIFAIGDVRSVTVERMRASVGEGGMAITCVHNYLPIAA